jgi:DNA-binding CsgD family transcriptional regulator
VALHDRYLLAIALTTAVPLVVEHSEPAQVARLLGAFDAMDHAAGANLRLYEYAIPEHPVPRMRERLEQGERESYREGQSLSFSEVATLALSLLNNAAQAFAVEDNAPAIAQLQKPSAPQASLLSAREQEVLQLIAQGLSSKAIGQRLALSPSTVNHHVKSIFNKLGVETRAQAVSVATQHGLI